MLNSKTKAVFSLVLVFAALAALLVLAGRAGASDGLVSHWPAEGTALDVHGTNNGTLEGGATFAAGQVGQGFFLDGVDDYVRVPHSTDLEPGTGSFTIKAWIKTSNQNNVQYVVVKCERCGAVVPQEPNKSYYLFQILSDGRTSVVLSSDSGADFQFFLGSTSVFDGAFHHIAFVRDTEANPPEGRLYVDGAVEVNVPLVLVGGLPGSIAASDPDTELDPLIIGATPIVNSLNVVGNFAGVLDELEYFNIALSTAEINAQYLAGLAPPPGPEPASIVLVPSGFVVNTVGDVQVLTATVTDTNGGPVAGVEVTFLEFQSFDIIGTDTTDVSGVAQISYTRLVPTNDIVRAEFQAGGFPQGSDDVLIDWVAAAPDPTPPRRR